MNRLMVLRTRLRLGLGLLGLLAVSTPIPAIADEVLGTATLTGGPLSMAAAAGPNFSAALDGSEQTATASIDIAVGDTRGTGEGWNLQITSTQLTTGEANPRTLPTTAMSITDVAATCSASTCTSPRNTIGHPVFVPAGSTPPPPEKFFNATAESGMGDFTVTPMFRLFIPGSAYAGSYTTTVTITIANGS